MNNITLQPYQQLFLDRLRAKSGEVVMTCHLPRTYGKSLFYQMWENFNQTNCLYPEKPKAISPIRFDESGAIQ